MKSKPNTLIVTGARASHQSFGTHTEAVQVGVLLFLSGTLPTEGRTAKLVGRVGAELDTSAAEGNVRDLPKAADGV
jgi:hypothetical protein